MSLHLRARISGMVAETRDLSAPLGPFDARWKDLNGKCFLCPTKTICPDHCIDSKHLHRWMRYEEAWHHHMSSGEVGDCCVCMERVRLIGPFQCNHVQTCYGCSARVEVCPLCRAPRRT